MSLGRDFAALLSTRERNRCRFLSPAERDLIDRCKARKEHRLKEQAIHQR